MNKLLTFSEYFAKCAQTAPAEGTYGYQNDPAYTEAQRIIGNPSLLNDFYARYPNDVMTLARYVDSEGKIQIDVSYNQGRYQVSSPNKNIPANVMAHINTFLSSKLPRSADPNTKFTTNMYWSIAVD
jgi:hypothetical protein